MIYLDNAASSSPKPDSVRQAVASSLTVCANPGRSGHAPAVAAARKVLAVREKLQSFFAAPDPFCFAFCLNCTDALNTAILGILRPGDHCVVTAFEHNSVLRVVHEAGGIDYTVVAPDKNGKITVDAIKNALLPHTRLVVCNHVSNVSGMRQPVEEIAALCREKKVLFLLDAAQSAGHIRIDLTQTPIDMMAFPGHKGLLGPQGTGGLYVRPNLPIRPLRRGGTGSESFSLTQPKIMPDRLESGTLNVPGICGLGAGIDYVSEHFSVLSEHEISLARRLSEGLSRIPGVQLHSPLEPDSGVVLFNLPPMDSVDIADSLDRRYGIAVRGGYHCAPLAHRVLGTEKCGGVRVSIGHANTREEIDACLAAVRELAAEME